METLSTEIISEIISYVTPGACNLAVVLMLCEVIFQFFMRLAFPRQFNKD